MAWQLGSRDVWIPDCAALSVRRARQASTSCMVRAMRHLAQPSLRHIRQRTGLALCVLVLLVLGGCAAGPGGGGSKSGTTVPTVTRTDRDGPPAVVPADLINQPDPEPKVEPIIAGGPNKPYSVLGQSYSPMASDVAWKQQGKASWYGTKFHGKKTSSGELYSLYGLTAAHPTLPIPSYVRVRNLANGKEVIVRVNDRGPFHSDRVLDLSYAAALKLGITSVGSAQVELQRLTFDEIRSGAWRRTQPAVTMTAEAEKPPASLADDPLDSLVAQASTRPVVGDAPVPAPMVVRDEPPARAYTQAARGFYVQLAALTRREGVEELQRRVHDELTGLAPMLAVFKEAAVFRLQIGPYARREDAQHAAHMVRQHLSIQPSVIERR